MSIRLARAPRPASVTPSAAVRQWNGARAGLAAVLITFLVLYGWLLVASDFLPYVFDNNESFSSLWHAYNLYHFDFRQSAGLTDEASSPHPEAHPFVHTHQGNMPRLFAFVLYVLGARSVETQIAFTTLLIGPLVIGLAFRLFWRLAGPLFATIACLVLLTDYFFVGQWIVVTYRIWHFVFVFGALLCTYELGGSRPIRWALGLLTLFALIFYYELVFAGFVTIFTGLFALWRHWRRPLRLVLVWATQVLGAVIGVGTLAVQLSVHFGADVALEDFRLTFLARNAAASDPAAREAMTAFFRDHHIVFWQNIIDVRGMRTVEQFFYLLSSSHLQWYGPLISLLTLLLLAGWALGVCGDLFMAWLARRPSSLDAETSPPEAGIWAGATSLEWILLTATVVGLGAVALGVAVFWDGAFLGLRSTGWSLVERTRGVGWLLLAPILAGAALAAWTGARHRRGVLAAIGTVRPTRLVAASVLMFGALPVIRSQPSWYDAEYEPLWHGFMQDRTPAVVNLIGTALVIGLAVALALAGPKRVLGLAEGTRLRGIVGYLVCGSLAYATVYVLSPGYVLSGYLTRLAPLPVFVLNVLVAIAVYLVVGSTLQAVRALLAARRLAASIPNDGLRTYWIRAGMAAVGAAFLVGSWVHVQVEQIALFPPTSYLFLKKLGEPPLKGLSLVSDSYIAPPTWYTGQWGYIDEELAESSFELTDLGYTFTRGTGTYLWLRDAATNPAYASPDLFICMRPPSLAAALQRERGKVSKNNTCSAFGIVEIAAGEKSSPFQFELIDRDPSPLDAWAIVRTRWDVPPFLLPLGEGANRRFVDVDRVEIGDQMTLRIRYRYKHQDGLPETGTRIVLEGVRRDGNVCTLMDSTDTDTLYLTASMRGRMRVVVTPSTAEVAGPRYDSARFVIGRDQNVDPCRGKTVRPE